MVLTYGKGRIFHTTMGHDIAALSCIGFITTLQRGTEWAATGEVSQKIPNSFPMADRSAHVRISSRCSLALLNEFCQPGENKMKMCDQLLGTWAELKCHSGLNCALCASRQSCRARARMRRPDTVKKVCAACHPAGNVLGKGMSREQWGGIVSNMISRGAKGTDAEFAQVVDYLSKNLPPTKRRMPATAANEEAAAGVCSPRPAQAINTLLMTKPPTAAKPRISRNASAAMVRKPGARNRGRHRPIVGCSEGSLRRYHRSVSEKGHPTQSGICERQFHESANRRSVALPASESRRYAAHRPVQQSAERPDRRSESRRGLFQRTRQMQHLPFAYRRSCRHREEVRSAGSAT